MIPSAYPISAAAKLTGIPLDTLRAWERRYGAVVPTRSARGRLYSEDQIRRLILLRQAVEHGHSIGQIAGIKDRGLRDLLEAGISLATAERSKGAGEDGEILAAVLEAIARYDYFAADREINRLAAAMASPRDFVHEAALPLMRIIGERWHEGQCSIAQEHMVSHLLSALLASMVRTYSPSNPPARVLFATPQNERHAFPILAAAMLAAVGGVGVLYLGSDLPAADIAVAARKSEADVVLLSVYTKQGPDIWSDLEYIARRAPRSTALWLGGPVQLDWEQHMANSRWLVLHDYQALEQQLKAIGARF